MRRAAAFSSAFLGLGGGVWLLVAQTSSRPIVELEHLAETRARRVAAARVQPEPSGAAPAPTMPGDLQTGAERPATEDDYLRELAVLRTEDPSRALDWVERGDEWYSAEGRKAEARQASRVTLLVDLGRMDEARRVAQVFLAAHPRSEYAGLVRGVTGIHPRPGKPAGI
jgi:hypothetical protein